MDHTTIEQSKKLLELGLNPDSADMVFTFSIKEDTYVPDKYPSCRKYLELYKEFVSLGFTKEHIENLICPCWSTSSLLEILSKIALSFDDDGCVSLSSWNGKMWTVNMFDCPIQSIDNCNSPVDACYEMVTHIFELKIK